MNFESHLKAAELFANLLDNRFSILGVKFGLNAVLDLIPEFGDFIALFLSLYLVWLGLRMKLPQIKIIQMLINILFNFLIGLIPIVGDAAYIFNKANLRNLRILKQHAQNQVIEGEVVSP